MARAGGTGNIVAMKVISIDGTALAVVVEGSGSPLMLVTGTGDDQTRWGRIAPLLNGQFTLYRVERRGRGESGDGDGYSMAVEIADMLALIDAIHAKGGPVRLLGHSHGAVISLEAAAKTDKLAALQLYEPPMPYYERVDGLDPRRALIDEMARHMAEGNPDEVVVLYLRDFLGTPMEAIERQRANPRAWGRWLSMVHTVPRELLAIRAYTFEPEKFGSICIPVQVLVGTASRPAMRRTAERVQAAIPGATLVELAGQGHAAMTSAPEMFASTVATFFNSAR